MDAGEKEATPVKNGATVERKSEGHASAGGVGFPRAHFPDSQ